MRANGGVRIGIYLWQAWRVLGGGAAEGAEGALGSGSTYCESPVVGVEAAAPC